MMICKVSKFGLGWIGSTRRAVAVALAAVLCAGVAQATTVWISPTGGDFNDGANWSGGAPAGDLAIFNAGTNLTGETVFLTAAITTNGLRFQNDDPAANMILDLDGFALDTTSTLIVGSALGDKNDITITDGTFSTASSHLLGTGGGSDNALTLSALTYNANASSPTWLIGANSSVGAPGENNQLIITDNTVFTSNSTGGAWIIGTNGTTPPTNSVSGNNNGITVEQGADVTIGSSIYLGGIVGASATGNFIDVLGGTLDAGFTLSGNRGIFLRDGTLTVDSDGAVLAGFINASETGGDGHIVLNSGLVQVRRLSQPDGTTLTIGDGGVTPATLQLDLTTPFVGVDANNDGTPDVGSVAIQIAANGRLYGGTRGLSTTTLNRIYGDVSALAAGAKAMANSEPTLAVEKLEVNGDWDNTNIELTLKLGDLTDPLLPHDLLDVNGEFTLGGTVVIDLATYVEPNDTATLQVIAWDSVVGAVGDVDIQFINGAPLMTEITPDGLYVSSDEDPGIVQSTYWDTLTPGDFLDGLNWTLGVPDQNDFAWFDNDFDGTITFSDSITCDRLLLQNTSGTITYDVDPLGLGQSFTIPDLVIFGSSAGKTNDVIVSSGTVESGLLLIGNAAGANGNQLEVTGAGTLWRGTGGDGGTSAIRVGSNGGSNSALTVSDGGRVESDTQLILGLQAASNNTVTVTDSGSELYVTHSFSIGDNTGAAQTNNQFKVLDGGYASVRELIIGTTALSSGNTVTVAGAGAHLNVRGGQQFQPTEVGQKNDVGRASVNNQLLISNGGTVDGGAIFLLGREATSSGNLLSVVDGNLSGTGVEIRRGTLHVDNSTVDISRVYDNLAEQYLGGSLLAEDPNATIELLSGTLATVNATVTNGSPLTVGDGGGTPATYQMKINDELADNGTHTFASGLVLNANGRLTGSGDIVGDVSAAAAGAEVAPGLSLGQIDVTGNWDNTGVNMTLELGDLSAGGLTHDVVQVSGTFTHGGSVLVDLATVAPPADPPFGIAVIEVGSFTGSSADTSVAFINGGPLGYRFGADGLYVYTHLLLVPCLNGPDVLTPPAGCTAADFAKADRDSDGDVDLRDIATLMTLP